MSSILITGGTGYFGRALVNRLLSDGTNSRICIYSRDEYKQAQMRKEFNDNERLRFFVGDVRDLQRLTRAMAGCDQIVHAAALKRVEVGEYNPMEMVKTNVLGTMNVIEAAHDAKPSEETKFNVFRSRRVVYLSTDKACNPINAYGASKLMGEKMMLAANNTVGAMGPKFAVTRYGNVAGSTGSVIPTWRAAVIKNQDFTNLTTVRVTDPNCTRFWMTAKEAVQLVLTTLDSMPTDGVVIPQLPAYRLGDLATAMGLEMHITGLHPSEKMHESMREGETSENARRMTIEELREALANV